MSLLRVGVVMAGGSGERFWPWSTPKRPKQLLNLTHPEKTMLQEAMERVAGVVGNDHVFLSISPTLQQPVLDQGLAPEDRILVEPTRRNTLGALCWVVASIMGRGHDDAVIAVVTADHRIGPIDKFQGCVAAAMDVAEDYKGIVTIGIPPSRAETGYGYIELDHATTAMSRDGRGAAKAHSFREKPSQETAEEFISVGNFVWNSGMFFFTAQTYLRELATAQPEAHKSTLAVAEAIRRGDHSAASKAFEELPNISVDYALMERAETVYTVSADFDWDDVGAWDALERSFEVVDGNVSQGVVVPIDSTGCILMNKAKDGVIGVVGCEDLVVVRTDEAVLVCPKSEAQRVRLVAKAVQEL